MTRILVVDDKDENLYYLDALLTGSGSSVIQARHGAEALVLARQAPPDLIISDLLMPVMDGYTLLRHWKADARLRHAPFIVYTATYTAPEDEELALKLGADAFILKPAEPDDFLARIAAVQDRLVGTDPAQPLRQGSEDTVLKSYSETLIRKLEEKSLQLEEANRALQLDIAERTETEARLRESITERRLLEEQFRQAQKMEAIGHLAGGVAHDFNNLLAVIRGNVELALDDLPVGHPVHASLEEIRKAGIRGTRLVQQILTFSRQHPPERRVIELGPVLREAIGFLRAIVPSTVEIVATVDPATPTVLADATQIHQVLVNLCTNAWHALENRAGRIEVRLESVSLDAGDASRLAGLRPGDFCRVSVVDTGKGMDAATLERAFDPFFTTKPPGKGTGLGLSVVHGILQAHDGAISVKSEPGKGSTFELYFPGAAQPEENPSAAAVDPPHGKGHHILFLDDEEPLVYLGVRMLERQGYRVSGFWTVEEALDAFRRDPGSFDVVVTDMNMVGANGLEVAAELLALRPDLPIVLCSGHVPEELREQARAIGIRDVLYKPSSMKEFAKAIGRLLVSVS